MLIDKDDSRLAVLTRFRKEHHHVYEWALRCIEERLARHEHEPVIYAALTGFGANGAHPLLQPIEKCALQLVPWNLPPTESRLSGFARAFLEHAPAGIIWEACQQDVLQTLRDAYQRLPSEAARGQALQLHLLLHEVVYQSLHCAVYRAVVQ